MATLKECIERFHAAHPEWPRAPLTLGAGAVSSAETTAGDSTVETQHLVFRPASVPSPRPPRSDEHAMRVGATQLGMSLTAYRVRVEAGLKWCFACRRWQPREEFGRRWSTRDGLNRICRAAATEQVKASQRRHGRKAS
jgi:hypothetical protein